MGTILRGERSEIGIGDERYPTAIREREAVPGAPERLYVVGDPDALAEGVAIVGARRCTPYGRRWAHRFGALCARAGAVVVNGGARGVDAAALEGALSQGGRCCVFLGGGIDNAYPEENAPLFQRVVEAGGAVASEHPWDEECLPYRFCARNRLTASLAKATLVVEAAVPSGALTTADYALAAGRDVWAVPGSIDSPASRGCNALIRDGAEPLTCEGDLASALAGMGFASLVG